jgi:hypothetical protein
LLGWQGLPLVLHPAGGVFGTACHRLRCLHRLRLAAQVDEATSTVMLDTSGGAWVAPATGDAPGGDDPARRCRHAVASAGPFVFLYGGLKGSQLLVRPSFSKICNGFGRVQSNAREV